MNVDGAPPLSMHTWFTNRGSFHCYSVAYHDNPTNDMCVYIYIHVPDHIISYHITSYHIISHHIISYHIISYHIISCHIISDHKSSYHNGIISYKIYAIYSWITIRSAGLGAGHCCCGELWQAGGDSGGSELEPWLSILPMEVLYGWP